MLRSVTVAIGAAVIAMTAVAMPAAAEQQFCGERDKIIEQLGSRYQESRTAIGLTSSGGVIEVYSSPDSGTWTFLLTMPGGQTCMVGAGDHWENMSPVAYAGPAA